MTTRTVLTANLLNELWKEVKESDGDVIWTDEVGQAFAIFAKSIIGGKIEYKGEDVFEITDEI